MSGLFSFALQAGELRSFGFFQFHDLLFDLLGFIRQLVVLRAEQERVEAAFEINYLEARPKGLARARQPVFAPQHHSIVMRFLQLIHGRAILYLP